LVYKIKTMRLTILFLLFAVTCISLRAQETDSAFASVRYSFTHVMDTTQPDNPFTENMILYLGKNMSNYTSYDRIERIAKLKADPQNKGLSADMKNIDASNIKSMAVNDGIVTITSNSGVVSSFIPNASLANSYFKNQSASRLSYLASAGGKMFSVEEKMPAIEWTITQEAKEIQGMQCQKATCDFKGRSYEAWFCSQLPYSNGPWKLGGLPGLIVEAYDTKKEVVFKFTSFENASGTQVAIALPIEVIKTTPKEFKQYQEAMEKNRQAMLGSNGGGGDMIRVTGVRITPPVDMNGNPVKPRRMNNPIEKEQK
jgi:GLPGLI family protein